MLITLLSSFQLEEINYKVCSIDYPSYKVERNPPHHRGESLKNSVYVALTLKILPTDLRLGEQTTSEIQPRNLSKFTRPIGTRTAILSRLIEAEDQSGTVTRGKPS